MQIQAEEIIKKRGNSPDKIVSILLEYQQSRDRNYLTEEDLKTIANLMHLPKSRLYSVATFYSLLSTVPRGRHVIQICRDVPCYLNGSYNVKNDLERKLNISVGETTTDGRFSLEYSSCLGYCELAPVVRIDGKIYGNLTSEKLSEIIAEYRRK